MSSGIRLLLFHEDGELKQIHFPALSPLWVLATLSALTLTTMILTIVCLRLYHEKRELSDERDQVSSQLQAASARIWQQGDQAVDARRSHSGESGPLKQRWMTAFGIQDAPDSLSDQSGVEVVMGQTSSTRVSFTIRAKQAQGEGVQGRVCGAFIGDNSVTLINNSKAFVPWADQEDPRFATSNACDPFHVKSGKSYSVVLESPLKQGVIQVYSERGELWQTINVRSARENH
jgi:hypothetical protein